MIVIDVLAERLNLAKEFGADITIDASSTTAQDRVKAVKEACESLGPEIVVEACGIPHTVGEGVEMLRRGGVLFEMGHLLKAEPASIPVNLVCRNEIEILGNYAYPSSNCLAYAAQVLKAGKLPYRDLIKCYQLDGYQQVLFGSAKGRKGVVKAVFRID